MASPGGLSGPSLVALDRQTGEPVWQAGTDQSGYSSPRLVTLAGKRQLMMFNRGWISGYDVRTGNQLWRQQWKGGGECVAMPIPLPPNRFLVSTGYGVGTRLFELDNQLNPRQIWRSRRMRAKFTNLIHRDGLIYGLSDGVLSCIELTEGKRAWRGKRYGHGQVLCVGDLLLIQADNGRVVLVRVSPQDYTELGSIQALSGKTWNPPTLAPPFLLVRNDRQAVCYRLPLK